MPTILVVEDEPIVRNLIVNILSRQGFVVFEADSAAEAMLVCQALKDETLDLLIADHGSGRACADQILATCPNIKVLHLSTAPYSAMRALDALVPGSSFLQKPFTAGQLTSAVQSMLDPRTQ